MKSERSRFDFADYFLVILNFILTIFQLYLILKLLIIIGDWEILNTSLDIFFISFPPVKVYKDITNYQELRNDLNRVAGVYAFENQINKKQYIGSSINMYSRVQEHVKKYTNNWGSSNAALQNAFSKYGLHNFHLIIYFILTDPTVVLSAIETEIISPLRGLSIVYIILQE
uniref:GIY-YIG endonuclease n=1 Tax=Coniophora puteana TaxID=80637 RepID=A0A896YSZ1_9AGAM